MATTTTIACSSSLPTILSHDKASPSTLSLSRITLSFLSPHHSLKLSTATPHFSRQSLIVPKVSEVDASSVAEVAVEAEAAEVKPAEAEAVAAEVQPAEVEETPLMPKGEELFAVVMIGGRQYIVFPGRFLYTQRLKGAQANDKIILNKVLLVGTRTHTYLGRPLVPNTVVHAIVEEQGLDDKVIVFKYKKKKNYRRKIGHRQPNTRIRIVGVTGYENTPALTMPKELLEK